MFACHLSSFSIRRHRRALTAAALVMYLLSVVGFPMPMPALASHDRSTPFPCQDHHCGCNSAEQCWRSCCCFSPEQRLAWAREHNVTLPDEVRAAMCESHEGHDHDGESCCASAADDHAASGHACAKCREPENTSQTRWVSGFQALKCQGLTLLWVAIGATLPLEIRSLWEYEWVPVGHVCTLAGTISPLSWQPSVPPPRA